MGMIADAACAWLGSVVARLGADEFKAWAPKLTVALIGYAVSKLPVDQRERREEEWASHVADIPGDLGKLWTASGFLRASSRINRDLEGRRKAEQNGHDAHLAHTVILKIIEAPIAKILERRVVRGMQRALEEHWDTATSKKAVQILRPRLSRHVAKEVHDMLQRRSLLGDDFGQQVCDRTICEINEENAAKAGAQSHGEVSGLR